MTKAADPPVEPAEEGLPPLPPEATIHERMVRILAELPAIGKNQENKQQGFMFRGYDDVLNALNPLLGEHGVYIIPDVIERVSNERATSKGSTMYEVNLHVRFRFYGLAGDSVTGSGWGEGTDMGDKATNKAMTMALKYVLFQAFAISTREASDADAASPEETRRGAPPAAPAESRDPRDPRRSWPQLRAQLDPYGEETVDDFMEFCAQASEVAFGERSARALTSEQRKRLLAMAGAAAVALVDAHDHSLFPPPNREEMQAAWGLILGDGDGYDGPPEGVALEGPPWSMGPEPSEAGRPSRDEHAEAQAPAAPPAAEAE